jgi:hypothetical protein
MRTIYCDGALGRGTVFPTNDGVRHRIPQQEQKCAGAPSWSKKIAFVTMLLLRDGEAPFIVRTPQKGKWTSFFVISISWLVCSLSCSSVVKNYRQIKASSRLRALTCLSFLRHSDIARVKYDNRSAPAAQAPPWPSQTQQWKLSRIASFVVRAICESCFHLRTFPSC